MCFRRLEGNRGSRQRGGGGLSSALPPARSSPKTPRRQSGGGRYPIKRRSMTPVHNHAVPSTCHGYTMLTYVTPDMPVDAGVHKWGNRQGSGRLHVCLVRHDCLVTDPTTPPHSHMYIPHASAPRSIVIFSWLRYGVGWLPPPTACACPQHLHPMPSRAACRGKGKEEGLVGRGSPGGLGRSRWRRA